MTTLHPVRGTVPRYTQADRLRKAREVTGLDQGQFAAAIGISRASVANYEHGRRVPGPLYVRAWAEVSGVDEVWLKTGDECDEVTRQRRITRH